MRSCWSPSGHFPGRARVDGHDECGTGDDGPIIVENIVPIVSPELSLGISGGGRIVTPTTKTTNTVSAKTAVTTRRFALNNSQSLSRLSPARSRIVFAVLTSTFVSTVTYRSVTHADSSSSDARHPIGQDVRTRCIWSRHRCSRSFLTSCQPSAASRSALLLGLRLLSPRGGLSVSYSSASRWSGAADRHTVATTTSTKRFIIPL